ncbi:MAG: BREX-3 system phosphatase PglZ [Firmicutes bacterium]|jgi:hypothetical protein|nr:BREX-3 system phosphatase PglZ [Bacillota bacterium]
MDNWRTQLLNKFMLHVSPLIIVADPDNLLLEEQLLHGINAKGFDLVSFDDPIAFRYLYESKYRSQWEGAGEHYRGLIIRTESYELNLLPYDLLQTGQQLSFNLGQLFPNLSYSVISDLDISYIDLLYKTQKEHPPGVLGDNATKNFILRYIFRIVIEFIRKPSDLLQVLLRRHYKNIKVPAVLDEYFVESLRNQGLFLDWPLEQIVYNKELFFKFLQERWPIFLNQLIADQGFMAYNAFQSTILEFKGPSYLPFGHDDVRIYMDSLFLDGILKPVHLDKSQFLSGTWVVVGIKSDPEEDLLRRLYRLAESVTEVLPTFDSPHQEWFSFAYRWAELSRLKFKLQNKLKPEIQNLLINFTEKLDSEFFAWIKNRYIGLYNQPPLPPVMLHHIPRVLARQVNNRGINKIALIVVDGLALSQWLIIRNILRDQRTALSLHENAVFAWVPTLTSVSRQALFSGKIPFYFPEGIALTGKDDSLWTQFWVDQGMDQREIAYIRGLGDNDLREVYEVISNPSIRTVGLVVNKIDRIMHGMELGALGMLNQVGQWATQGYLARLLDILFDCGFDIVLTSDHGNIEAIGCGIPKEGVTADLRGERVRIYSNDILRKQVKALFPDSIEWPTLGLPDGFLPLFAPARTAFTRKGVKTVAHGGISLEEVIVPLIHIQRRIP